MKQPQKKFAAPKSASPARGFTMLELLVASVVLLVVVGGAVNYISLATQRSKSEQVKVDLVQEGREFVDEFERDIHQAGFPGCGAFNGAGTVNCTAMYNNVNIADGLVYVSNTRIIFEGDITGLGTVASVQYELVDSNLTWPPASTCPCIIQRSQVPKVANASYVPGTSPIAGGYTQATNWSQELQNVINSGVPGGTTTYGGGLPLAGNVLFDNGAITNTAYYAQVTTMKDFPIFTAYDQFGAVVPLPLDNSTKAGQQALATIRSIRLTINLLGTASAGYDQKTGVRPVVTLVGDGRRGNKMAWE
jgi:prepilin-type N-terminal cleavage/methylation domain-containing protein